MDNDLDVIVLGGGPAGETAAGVLAETGMKVALVESELIGGECAFYACMPSKALLRPEQLRREVERVPGLAPQATEAIRPASVLSRRDEVTHYGDDASQLPWLEDRNIATFRGHARITASCTVEVMPTDGGEQAPVTPLRARLAVIVATGSAASYPPVDGLESVGPWNNRQATTAAEVPESMIVMGGGPVGCELAQAWASLGSDVVLIEADSQLLPREEHFAGQQVEIGLTEYGVDVRLGTALESVQRRNGLIEGRLSVGGEVVAKEILVATGRKPRTEGIGLETVGVSGGGFLPVDSRLRVAGAVRTTSGRPWLYAVGDVNGRALLTHTGKYQARIAAADILREAALSEGESSLPPSPVAEADVSPLLPPRVTFTDPQVAAIGLTERQARELGIEIAISETETSGTAGASFHGRGVPGTSRLIVDSRSGLLVGATFVGFETAELLHAATIAIVGEVPIDRLWHAVPAFPTRSEIWLSLLDQLR